MGKLHKFRFFVAALCCLLSFGKVPVQAAGNAVFYVQTAVAKEGNMITVSVYLDGEHIGGIDAEVLYDPKKADFVSSSQGVSLSSFYSDISYDARQGDIHYIMLYPEGINAHGILMDVTFRLREGASYQPELQVIDLIDDSDEIRDMGYTISYQQADGTWSDVPDTSGVLADDSVAEAALEQYGAPEDLEGEAAVVTLDSENRISGTLADAEMETDIGDIGDTWSQSSAQNGNSVLQAGSAAGSGEEAAGNSTGDTAANAFVEGGTETGSSEPTTEDIAGMEDFDGTEEAKQKEDAAGSKETERSAIKKYIIMDIFIICILVAGVTLIILRKGKK